MMVGLIRSIKLHTRRRLHRYTCLQVATSLAHFFIFYFRCTIFCPCPLCPTSPALSLLVIVVAQNPGSQGGRSSSPSLRTLHGIQFCRGKASASSSLVASRPSMRKTRYSYNSRRFLQSVFAQEQGAPRLDSNSCH